MSDVVLDAQGVVPVPQHDDNESTRGNRATKWWWVCGSEVPRDEIVFFAQVIISYIVIITCIINLSLQNGDSSLFTTLLSLTLGYILPSPKLQSVKTSSHQ